MTEDIKAKAKQLCDHIREIYPEIGECGVNVDDWFDDRSTTWMVHLWREGHELKTHIEPDDVTACIEGKQCLHLGVQVQQLIMNVKAA